MKANRKDADTTHGGSGNNSKGEVVDLTSPSPVTKGGGTKATHASHHHVDSDDDDYFLTDEDCRMIREVTSTSQPLRAPGITRKQIDAKKHNGQSAFNAKPFLRARYGAMYESDSDDEIGSIDGQIEKAKERNRHVIAANSEAAARHGQKLYAQLMAQQQREQSARQEAGKGTNKVVRITHGEGKAGGIGAGHRRIVERSLKGNVSVGTRTQGKKSSSGSPSMNGMMASIDRHKDGPSRQRCSFFQQNFDKAGRHVNGNVSDVEKGAIMTEGLNGSASINAPPSCFVKGVEVIERSDNTCVAKPSHNAAIHTASLASLRPFDTFGDVTIAILRLQNQYDHLQTQYDQERARRIAWEQQMQSRIETERSERIVLEKLMQKLFTVERRGQARLKKDRAQKDAASRTRSAGIKAFDEMFNPNPTDEELLEAQARVTRKMAMQEKNPICNEEVMTGHATVCKLHQMQNPLRIKMIGTVQYF